MTTVRTSLPAGTMAVPAARRCTSDTMNSWGIADRAREIAELVVSELVGNAVEHGGGVAEFALTLHDDTVRVEVVDHNADLPVPSHPDPFEARHRGLLIVAALSTRWGSAHVGTGKSVWAELPNAGTADDDPTRSLAEDDRSLSG
ncbi:MAG TPA: ATP-binding protein [Pseudonocardiaceae bacterium]|nr:ATP-binding protein [Pseudonocardiaceae bacterium]